MKSTRQIDSCSKAEDAPVPFPDEIAHLEQINRKLEEALEEADKDVLRADRDYRDAKRYMVDFRGEIDPHEMFQSELLLKQTDRSGAFAVQRREQIAKLKDSPYFARVDFSDGAPDDAFAYYIGRFSFRHEHELLIFDWRAPIASLFYDCEVGPAAYDAPAGRINGMLSRKRQFKIINGEMEYALESSSQVRDDVLQRELSHTSDEKMKSIITTIQKEQNSIIRNERTGTLIIQGVAGSGKTSIALHRVAYLLYRFQDRLSARNVAILSPNKVFGDYISSVIPELGEEPIFELSLAEIAELQMERVVGFEPDRDPLEIQDKDKRERARFKSTLEFVSLLQEYRKQLPHRIFAPVNYTFGRFTVDSEWIGKRFHAYGGSSIRQRLVRVADDILDRFSTDNVMQEELPTAKAILKSLSAMLTVKNTLTLYKNFYEKLGHPELFCMSAKNTLEWADVFPFLYLHAALDGLKESVITRHLVIDEMQDYTPIQYAVLNLLFPCQKTILGDFGQLIHPDHSHTLEDIVNIYPDAELVRLNKSYRSTFEIMTFAKGIQNVSSLQPVERHGLKPEVISCGTEEEEFLRIQRAIQDFEEGANASLGILLKTDADAKALYDVLSKEREMHLITPQSTSFHNGVSITSIRMAKGLEFDEVVLPHTDSDTYRTQADRSLLYIACTRAMHRLTLTHQGDKARFLP